MPRVSRTRKTTKSAKTPLDIKPKPDDRSSVSQSPSSLGEYPADPRATPKKPKKPKETKNKAWTNEELIQLFETVAKAGGGRKIWEGAVEGRTSNQCFQAWVETVTPFLKKALANKTKSTRCS